ncbi:DUF317 domain-containing protein [Streptomyces olivaceus]|uniref:DUF317 domain-containing protein n=1 Tax=Streptomyces olivaceus TaxID=47716 RepID=UPI00382CA92B
MWRINAYINAFGPPAWGVCFNDSAPTELVTAFTSALAEAYRQGPDHYLARPLAGSAYRDPLQAVSPLIRRGWQFDRPDLNTFAITAPDRLPTLEYATGGLDPAIELETRAARWHLWTGTSSARPFWYATASTGTPAALLRAVTEAVSNPAPLPRWHEDTHSYVRDYAQLSLILPPRPPSPTPLDVRRAAASRRPAGGQRPALEHYQPTGPARPAPIARACLDRRTFLSLHAPEFFTELRLPFHGQAAVGNTYLAAPAPGARPRLRIGFTRTTYADTYGGIRLAVVHPDRGEIDAAALSFLDHGTFDRRDVASSRPLDNSTRATFSRHHRPGQPLWEEAEVTGLRDAIEQYTGVWFPGAWTACTPHRAAGGNAHPAPAQPSARGGPSSLPLSPACVGAGRARSRALLDPDAKLRGQGATRSGPGTRPVLL